MKNGSENQEKVLDYIKANPGSTIEAITEGTQVSNLLVRKAVKELQAGNIVESNDEDGGLTFKGKNGTAAEIKEPGEQTQPITAKKKKEETDLGPKTFTGRDNSKYRFGEHRNLPKGRLVLALVRAYVDKNPRVSLSRLQEIFQSKDIQPRFGVLEELKVAKSFTKNSVDRFFLKNEDIIKLGNGTKIAVCSQWMPESIGKILKLASAQPLGFRVKVEDAAE